MRPILTKIIGAVLALAAAATARSCSSGVPQAEVTEVAELGTPPSWAENLAFRPDGSLLVTRFYDPVLYHVDVTTGTVIEVHAWNTLEHIGVLGIGEAKTTTDVFYVAVAALLNGSLEKVGGENTIYRVDMRPFRLCANGSAVERAATVTELAAVTEAGLLNGLVVLDDERHLLVADSLGGVVYSVDTATGAYRVAINDSLMSASYAADPKSSLGINGVKIYKDHLYWSNSAASLVARVPIDSHGNAKGPSSVAVADVDYIDDFAIRGDGVAFLCQNQIDTLSVAYLSSYSAVTAVAIAGSNTSTALAGVTAGMFGPSNAKRLYLTTAGGVSDPVNGTITVSGTVSYIDTQAY